MVTYQVLADDHTYHVDADSPRQAVEFVAAEIVLPGECRVRVCGMNGSELPGLGIVRRHSADAVELEWREWTAITAGTHGVTCAAD